MPIAKVLLLDFACKSKALDPKGVNDVFASTGQMFVNFYCVWKQNSRISAGTERCGIKTFSIVLNTGICVTFHSLSSSAS